LDRGGRDVEGSGGALERAPQGAGGAAAAAAAAVEFVVLRATGV